MDKWQPFIGNNHNMVNYNARKGGQISFTAHIGKPLTDELWDDLVCRLQVTRITVVLPDAEEWCIGWGNHVRVCLDRNNLVEDITYTP